MMISQAWIRIIRVVLVLTTIAIAIVTAIERINAATSWLGTTSQPVAFAQSEPAGTGTFRVRLQRPVPTDRIFPMQIRLNRSPDIATFYTPRGGSVEKFGSGLFTVQKSGWLIFSTASGLDPRTVTASGELVTPKVFSARVARLLSLILAMNAVLVIIVFPDLAFATRILSARSICVIRTTLGWIGRHPFFVLAIPSLYFLLFYPPLWKDIDALSQLVLPASVNNIFHFSAIYCFLARIPLWIGDCLANPRPLELTGTQQPTIMGIYCLVALQHAVLVSVLVAFCRTVTRDAVQRGVIALLFATSSAPYAQAQTCGSEAWSLVGLMLVFTLGLRIYYAKKPTALRWVWYFGALTLAIGSRHINVLLGFWLVAVFLILGFLSLFFRRYVTCAASSWWQAGLAALCFAAAIAVDIGFASVIAKFAGVEPRTTLGRTLSDRIKTFLDTMPEEERRRVAESMAASAPDGDVRAAILDQATIGRFYDGTGAAISRRLAAQGYQGEALGAKTDSVILEASLVYLRSFHPKLLEVIGRDLLEGFAGATNSSIAIAPFDHNRYAAEVRPQEPELWRPLNNLHSSFLPEAIAWEDRANKDGYVSGGKRLRIGWSYIVASLLCVVSFFRRAPVLDTVLPALSVMVAGLVIFGATMVCEAYMKRYALPLQVSGLVGLSLAFSGLFQRSDFAPLKARLT